MTLDANEFLARMTKRTGFSEADKSLLKNNADWGLTIAPDMADAFYAYLGRDEEMDAILNATEGRVHRLRETFVQWFYEMFTGMDEWGTDYADRRWRIGLIHVKVGIGPQHVVPAMATVMAEVGKRLKADGKADNLRDALSRSCMVDLAFIEQAYIEVTATAVLKETGWTEGLFRRLIATGAATMA
ncbi:protoglobin domain-containing protein [Leptolyngbya sp. PCC 6406]|uniref:protoglobin domain-containing protein n=1 Tax=Leptolyngbya sp. PCC 6406 TaxID=1173264 RepID=UPI0002ABB270|nr:protoglobin domain-containing protein [Leptolyngbya sp. PCC 6406]